MMNVPNKFGVNRMKIDEAMGVNVYRLISYGFPLIRKSGKVFSTIFGRFFLEFLKNEKILPHVSRDERA